MFDENKKTKFKIFLTLILDIVEQTAACQAVSILSNSCLVSTDKYLTSFRPLFNSSKKYSFLKQKITNYNEGI